MPKNYSISSWRCLIGGLSIALVSSIYNFLVFYFFGVRPDLSFEIRFFDNFYLLVFLKNFLVGIILMWFFAKGYFHLKSDRDEGDDNFWAVIYFAAYGIVALCSFSLTDLVLMNSNEGLFVLITFDGFVETFIAMMPLRFLLR